MQIGGFDPATSNTMCGTWNRLSQLLAHAIFPADLLFIDGLRKTAPMPRKSNDFEYFLEFDPHKGSDLSTLRSA